MAFFKILWCLFVHKNGFVKNNEGDWKKFYCPQCNQHWVEPR